MKKYYVNKIADSNGIHQIHDEDCINLPPIFNRRYLGRFDLSFEAFEEAKKIYKHINGCMHCTDEWHVKLIKKHHVES
jgi:hypothetical protein